MTRAAYRIAAWLAMGQINMTERMLRPPGRFERARFLFAHRLLDAVITDVPRSWKSMWIAGKILERFQQYSGALEYFRRGLEVNPRQPDLAIEASLAAVYLGIGDEAEKYATIAVDCRPEDAGHRSDLALALLVAGKPHAAKSAVQKALELAPNDRITHTLHRLIVEIIDHSLPCPRNMAEIQELSKKEGITNRPTE